MDKIKLLKSWINNNYLNPQTIVTIKQSFQNNNPKSIQLNHFLIEYKFKKLQKSILKSKFELNYKPDCCSFYKTKKTNKSVNDFIKFIQSNEFSSLISFIYNKKTKFKSFEVIRFEHGNYTLLHDEINDPKQLRLIFDFTNYWSDKSGGYNSYIYDSEEILRINPTRNSLSLIDLNGKIKSFVKYVNNKSKNNQAIFLIAKFN